MLQPLRETALRFVARRAAALAFAGLLAAPLFLSPGRHEAEARIGQPSEGTSSVTGAARAIDGDTLDVAGVRVRLEGIDAPEIDQTCGRPWLGSWKCGKESQEHLARLVRDRTVTCTAQGLDAYRRLLATCVVAGLDVNADLVRNGLAWAFVKYSQRYVEVEAEARAGKRGVWQGQAKPAWIWRAERWKSAEAQGQGACLIKGNIGRGGPVYHMPWDRWYTRTRVETAKGERWFCTEAEAQLAGWRPASPR